MIENIYKKQNSQDIKSITSNKVVMKPETDWVHGDRCVVCDSQFTKLTEREHHCRVCGKPVCGQCSKRSINQQRACDICVFRVQMYEEEKIRKDQNKLKKEYIDQLKDQILELQQQIQEQVFNNEQEKNKKLVAQYDQLNEMKKIEELRKRKAEQVIVQHGNNEKQRKLIQIEQSQVQELVTQNENLQEQVKNLTLNKHKRQHDIKVKVDELEKVQIELNQSKQANKGKTPRVSSQPLQQQKQQNQEEVNRFSNKESSSEKVQNLSSITSTKSGQTLKNKEDQQREMSKSLDQGKKQCQIF